MRSYGLPMTMLMVCLLQGHVARGTPTDIAGVYEIGIAGLSLKLSLDIDV